MKNIKKIKDNKKNNLKKENEKIPVHYIKLKDLYKSRKSHQQSILIIFLTVPLLCVPWNNLLFKSK